MTFPELQIQLDLNPDNRVNVLKNVDTCRWIDYGYLFVDQENGQCYLFDKNGTLDDIDKVKDIKISAFENCIFLKNIEIPDSVKYIERWAFTNCKSLTNIKIPYSVEGIGYSAFYNCTSLISIKIQNAIKIIGDYAFVECTSLASIEISNSVKHIGSWAFDNCSSLKELVFKGKTMDQVKAMKWYPWGIKDKSIIKTES